jgi:hypothetical protein
MAERQQAIELVRVLTGQSRLVSCFLQPVENAA